MDRDETWLAGRPRPRPHCVRWGSSSPTERGTAAPHIRNLWAQALPASIYSSVHVYCGQTAGWIKMKLGMEVGLGLRQIVKWGAGSPPQRGTSPNFHEDPSPPPPTGHSPQFSAHACCGQTAGWIKMPFGREVGLGPGHIVLGLDGDQLPFPRGAQTPIFGPCLLWPNGRPSQLLLSTCW